MLSKKLKQVLFGTGDCGSGEITDNPSLGWSVPGTEMRGKFYYRGTEGLLVALAKKNQELEKRIEILTICCDRIEHSMTSLFEKSNKEKGMLPFRKYKK
jgi:hypothetical protein